MPRPSGYDIDSYGDMIDCEPRMSVYAEALRRAVTPGCTVFDIGAGFGVFSILACKYGAGQVVAIEPDPSVELVMPMAQANGCADRITVVRDLSTNYVPAEKADVIVSDIRGTMPLFENHIETILDARGRLLKPGGIQLPMRDTIRLALARSPKTYRLCERPWSANDYGLDLSPGREYAVNREKRTYLSPGALVSEPVDLATLDYTTITSPDLDRTVELVATRDTEMHGLLIWFDAEIAEGLTYSNGPGQPELVYGQSFFPFPVPVRVRAGDTVVARIRARLAGRSYIWSWSTKVVDGKTGEIRHSFNQSTFKSKIVTRDQIAPLSPDHVPQENEKLAIERDCLALVGEGRSVADIASVLSQRYPGRFRSETEASKAVSSLLMRYKST